MQEDKKGDLNKYQDQIRELLKMEIISKYYFQKGKVQASLKHDPDIAIAVNTLRDPERYNSILNGKYIQPAGFTENPDEDDTGVIGE